MADELISRAAAMQLFEGIPAFGNMAKMMLDCLPAVDAVVLPCKVGDTVWVVFANGIRPYVVDRIHIMANNQVKVRMRFMVTETLYQTEDNFGKTVFLTREEAEAALEGRAGNAAD